VYQTHEINSSLGRILIVDDEADICFFLSQNLKKRGYTTSYSHTVRQAEKQIEKENPNVLLLDNHLPDGNGVDLLERVHQKYPGIKVVMITAHDSPADRSAAQKNGVDFFLAKPFTISEVNNVVDMMMTKNKESQHKKAG
jgi:two-component system, OmpR family, response regulator